MKSVGVRYEFSRWSGQRRGCGLAESLGYGVGGFGVLLLSVQGYIGSVIVEWGVGEGGWVV